MHRMIVASRGGIARGALLRRNDGMRNMVAVAVVARSFSDNLLGYSPMAAPPVSSSSSSSSTNANNNTAIPTAKDVTTAGGVWAPTSAKRDKLTELKLALTEHQESLDDAASPQEKLDLYLADGLLCIVKMTDQLPVQLSSSSSTTTSPPGNLESTKPLQEMVDWLQDKINSGLQDTSTSSEQQQQQHDQQLHQVQWEDLCRSTTKKLEHILASLPPADQSLRDVRNFLDANQLDQQALDELLVSSSSSSSSNDNTTHNNNNNVDDMFREAVVRFRLLLAMAAAEHLQTSWKVLTLVSDQDRDRAAVKGFSAESHVNTLSAAKLHRVFLSYLQGSCTDRVDAVWSLFDKDEDGLLDKDEMNQVCEWMIAPMVKALDRLMDEALNARPVKDPIESDGRISETSNQGWRQRRREAREKKKLSTIFKKTLKTHFQDEVEMPHRLRCIYAWANKQDQDNRVDSVLVDEEGWNGRKRYVELFPKISLSEFREVQQEHFTHLDRVGAEYIKSFREDLLVMQGKGRQNRELIRDCTLFLTVVCALDYAILML